jgi:hypothetical protein
MIFNTGSIFLWLGVAAYSGTANGNWLVTGNGFLQGWEDPAILLPISRILFPIGGVFF